MPTRFGCACLRRRAEAQPKNRDAAAGAFKHEALAQRQRRSPDRAAMLDHHRSERRAGQGVMPGAQEAPGVRDTQQQRTRRIEPQGKPPRAGQRAIFLGGKIRLDPEDGLGSSHKTAQTRGKACGRRLMPGRGEDLVQRAPAQAAPQAGIGAGMAERNPPIFRQGLDQRCPGKKPVEMLDLG